MILKAKSVTNDNISTEFFCSTSRNASDWSDLFSVLGKNKCLRAYVRSVQKVHTKSNQSIRLGVPAVMETTDKTFLILLLPR